VGQRRGEERRREAGGKKEERSKDGASEQEEEGEEEEQEGWNTCKVGRRKGGEREERTRGGRGRMRERRGRDKGGTRKGEEGTREGQGRAKEGQGKGERGTRVGRVRGGRRGREEGLTPTQDRCDTCDITKKNIKSSLAFLFPPSSSGPSLSAYLRSYFPGPFAPEPTKNDPKKKTDPRQNSREKENSEKNSGPEIPGGKFFHSHVSTEVPKPEGEEEEETCVICQGAKRQTRLFHWYEGGTRGENAGEDRRGREVGRREAAGRFGGGHERP
jgi:hypothetical protein